MTGRRVTKPMVGLQNALAQTVVDALADSEISQEAFAAMLGMSPKHVSQMLTGTTGGSLAVWNLMLFTLGVNRIDIHWAVSQAAPSYASVAEGDENAPYPMPDKRRVE